MKADGDGTEAGLHLPARHAVTEVRTSATARDGLPPIAIVGMAARLPGGVNDIPSMYEFLREKKDGQCEVPASRFNIDGFHNEGEVAYSMRNKKAYFIDDDVGMMDAGFFGLSEIEAAGSDPRARLLLEVVYECLENGGQTAFRGQRIGTYIGAWGVDWAELTLKDGQQRNPMLGTAAGSFFLSSYIAWNLDFHGPTMTIETACSASMVALHEACQGLYSGECSAAIVGGANLILTPTLHMNLAASGVLSPDGVCKTFDASADGFGRGEAVNAVLLKPLDAAIRDGDNVRAVIRSTAVNNDGNTLILSTPSADAQEELIRHAYNKAGISDFDQTAYFECHGTGTMAGDTAEMTAVTNIFKKKIHVGSLKPNFGHSEGTSGITSLIKAVLSLEKRTLLPHIHMTNPNPQIPFEEAGLIVPKKETPWPAGRMERISVNNFGVGGTNVHVGLFSPTRAQLIEKVILDSASSLGLNEHITRPIESKPKLMLVSANNEKSLQRRTEQVEAYLAEKPETLNDLAYTLGQRREHLSQKAFALATKDGPRGSFTLGPADIEKVPEITFVFTGQGAQWAAMGKSLLAGFDGFRHSIEGLDRVLQSLDRSPAWSLKDLLCKEGSSGHANQAELAQPLCCALQIGLVDLFASWGIAPQSVIGHSSGEIAAAYAAGAITAEDAIRIAYHRGRVLSKIVQKGGMAAVSLGREQVTPFLEDGVVIACENSQQSVTLSGDLDKLTSVTERIKSHDPELLCRMLRVDRAYHSPHMQDVGDEYDAALKDISPTSSMIPLFSTVTGAKVTNPKELDARYWRRNLESPVLFLTGTQCILSSDEEETSRVFVEIGPHSALSGPIRQIISESGRTESPYVPSLVRGEDSTISVLVSAGNLHNAGIPVDIGAINGEGNLLVDLPPYPWQHDTRYWSQTPAVEAWRQRKYPHHELLGSRVLGSTDIEPSWRNSLSLDDAPWLYGHRVMSKTLFPGAGYIAMAGEAVQQITGSEASYQIGHLLLKYALFIDSNEAIELITNLRPVRISDLQDSDWFEFSITTVQAGENIRVCTGQVRLAPSKICLTMPWEGSKSLQRKVSPAAWYKALRESGMDYNREFRGLEEVHADPMSHNATATVKVSKVSPSRYVMHPTTIDHCLQLLPVAMFRGLTRNINIRSLPVLFEDIFVGPEPAELHVQAQADPGKGSFVLGELGARSDTGIALSINGARLHVLGDESEQDTEPAVRATWMPHIDFLPAKTLAKPPPPLTKSTELRERVADLYIAETAARARGITPKDEHLVKYKRWLDLGQARVKKQPVWPLSEFASDYDCPFDSSEALEMINLLRERREELGYLMPLVDCMHRVLENITGLLDGSCNALHLLMEDDGIKDVYDILLSFDSCSQFFNTLGHSNAELKILEVGAGTGSATARLLEYLHASDGTRLYEKYTFTDVSAGFLAPAKERFARYDRIEYSVLNINEDPEAQGFKKGHYDLVIASNVIHATLSLSQSLSNIKALLAPGGRLFLQELGEEVKGAEYIFGLLPGWWVGDNDNRTEKPYVSVDRWREEAVKAGFPGIDFTIHEADSPMASLVSTCPIEASARSINLLLPAKQTPWTASVEQHFAKKGYTVNVCSLDQPPGEGAVISLLDAAGPFLFEATEQQFNELKAFLTSAGVKHVLWVTRSSQTTSPDARYGLLQGFLRTLQGESHADNIGLSIFEIDEFNNLAIPHIFDVQGHLARKQPAAESRRDEFALRDGVVHVGRLEAVSPDEEILRPVKADIPRRLGLESTGLIDSMFWKEDPLPFPDKGEVMVRVAYVGLNFKDIITALGLIATPDQLGLEGSGVIESVGPGVSKFRPGDKVIFIGPGSFATHLKLSTSRVIPLPDMWTLEEGATSPIVSLTAAQCLLRMGNLRRGQSVLIHAACGGVGIAAIRICQTIGATIYATVGNEDKANHLADTFNIPRSHIFHSRDSSFHDDLMRETAGRGADIVLSSLAGELLRTSWACVAPGGTMFDISRRDVLADAMLPMKGFVDRRSFVTMDLGEYMEEAKDQSADFSIPVKEGLIGPIAPVTCYDAADIAEAFRYMQTGKHMGKILVKMPDTISDLPTRDTKVDAKLSPDAAYLLCGGLGGLGRALSNWMVERGARCLVYLSPSAGVGEDHETFADELRCQGCEVVFVRGTAAEIKDVEKATSLSPKPVKGVVQLALALKDVTFERISFEEWTVPLTAKVHGTRNLHLALKDKPLDFFLMFGSVAGVFGMAGQCNYSAANTFITSLAKHRHSLGLTASVLDLGVVADIGYVSRSPELMKTFSGRLEWRFIKEKEILEAVEILLHHAKTPPPPNKATGCYDLNHLIIGIATTAPFLRPRGDARMAILSNKAQRQQENAAEADDLEHFVAQIEAEPELLDRPATEEFLIKKVGYMIKSPSGKKEGAKDKKEALAGKHDLKALGNISIDSLIAIEARAWARKRLGVQISLADITAAGNVKGLVGLAIAEMKKRYSVS